MYVKVSGVCLEEVYRKIENQEIRCIRLFQKGEKKLVEIKNVPSGIGYEGEYIEVMCRLFVYNGKNGPDVSLTYEGASHD